MSDMSRSDFRKYAGLPLDIVRELKEEKSDLSTDDLFRYVESAMSDAVREDRRTKDEPSTFQIALSCCEALEKRGYNQEPLSQLRNFFAKMQAAVDARKVATEAFAMLSSQRWDLNEIY